MENIAPATEGDGPKRIAGSLSCPRLKWCLWSVRV